MPGNVGHLERGETMCKEQKEPSIDSLWFPVFSSLPISTLISTFLFLSLSLALGIYIPVLNFMINITIYFSQNAISYLHIIKKDIQTYLKFSLNATMLKEDPTSIKIPWYLKLEAVQFS